MFKMLLLLILFTKFCMYIPKKNISKAKSIQNIIVIYCSMCGQTIFGIL